MKGKAFVLCMSGAAAGLLASALFSPFPVRIIYNPTPSAATGFYWIGQKPSFQKGDFVAALPPSNAQELAAARGYLPMGAPVLKTIYAVHGDRVCAENAAVSINGEPVAGAPGADSLGRPMPAGSGCSTLAAGEYFLLSVKIPNSFDSRYFGPVDEDRILGVAAPLAVFAE